MRERIISFLETINIGSSQFAEEIGVQPSGISHILSGRNNPSLDFVLKVLKRYPDLSTEWLLFGKGAMYGIPGIISGNQAAAEGNQGIAESEAVNSETPPEYLTGLFAGMEGNESRPVESGGEESSGGDASRGAGPEGEGGTQLPTYPVDNKYHDDKNTDLLAVKMAERLILIYGDGSFEQFSLRQNVGKNSYPERDK